MKVLTKVLVGSRLHGLHTEKSDYDWRGVHIHDLKDVLSPFKNLKNTSWIESDEDNTSYELADFCKLATKGNATILEVFFSNKIEESSEVTDVMRANWKKFMDTDQFVAASRGYAHNQYNKMKLFEPDHRTPKFIVAYIRVLWQAAEFLKTGVFPCQITEEPLRKWLLAVKNDFDITFIPEATEKFMEMQMRVTDEYAAAQEEGRIMKPDIKWIEDFIYWAYTQNTIYNMKTKEFDNGPTS